MRITTHRFIAVFSMALTAALTLGALSQNVVAQEATSPDENLKQIALTDAQIESFIGAQKEMVPIVAKAPEGGQTRSQGNGAARSCGQEIQVRELCRIS